MNLSAIVVAAGRGSRMQSDIPKQFLLLGSKPLYFYAVEAFIKCFPHIEVVLVIPADHATSGVELLNAFNDPSPIRVVTGGETRFESVQKGLAACRESDFVFIHDAVRPFITDDFLHQLLTLAQQYGSAIPATPIIDSLRLLEGETHKPVDRNAFRAIQTPQVFPTSIIKRAYQQSYHDSFTDDATVMEAAGLPVFLAPGLVENIKITTPTDWKYAQWYFDQQLNQH